MMPHNQIPVTGKIPYFPNQTLTVSFETWLELSTSDPIVLPVPPNLALGDDRFYVCIGGWCAGIQLSRTQAYQAIERIGLEREPKEIYKTIELLIDGGAR